jgi:DNA-binding transcriptional MerR regulator
MQDKAADAFRTISEVAELLDVPQHVLRFWETRFAQVKPMKRGGGRRLYRPQDVDLLTGIRKLLYSEGYTIRGVQKILKEEGVAHVHAIGKGETGARKPDDDPKPQPKEIKVPPPPGRAPLARPRSEPPKAPQLGRLSEAQLNTLKLALKELDGAKKFLGVKDGE